MKKQVWLNMNTGEFSNSWSKEADDSVTQKTVNEYMEAANKENWKLIEYACLNDESFEFYHLMKIVTNR